MVLPTRGAADMNSATDDELTSVVAQCFDPRIGRKCGAQHLKRVLWEVTEMAATISGYIGVNRSKSEQTGAVDVMR